MVFQSYALYPHMTVFDNMAFALKQSKTPKDEIQKRVTEAAKVLQIETRVECLEEGEDASDKVSNAQIEQATLDSYIVGE